MLVCLKDSGYQLIAVLKLSATRARHQSTNNLTPSSLYLFIYQQEATKLLHPLHVLLPLRRRVHATWTFGFNKLCVHESRPFQVAVKSHRSQSLVRLYSITYSSVASSTAESFATESHEESCQIATNSINHWQRSSVTCVWCTQDII